MQHFFFASYLDTLIDCVSLSLSHFYWEKLRREIQIYNYIIFILQYHKDFLIYTEFHHLSKVFKIPHNYNKITSYDDKQNHMEVTIIINTY